MTEDEPNKSPQEPKVEAVRIELTPITQGTKQVPIKEKPPKVIENLPDDDQPIPLKMSEPYCHRKHIDAFGMVQWVPVTKFVENSFSLHDLVEELDRRPKGRFEELDDINFRQTNYCRCADCCSERRDILRTLRPEACENR